MALNSSMLLIGWVLTAVLGSAVGTAEELVVVGRAIDEEARPIGDSSIRCVAYHWDSEGQGWVNLSEEIARTGKDGSFEAKMHIPRETVDLISFWIGYYRLSFVRPSKDGRPIDVGNVELADPSSPYLEGMSDERLLDRYRVTRDLKALRHCEACLGEMVRRGGATWLELMKGEYERHKDEPYSPLRLTLLTVLHRLKGLSDPFRVHVTSARDIDARSMADVEIQFELRNTTDEPLHLPGAMKGASGVLECRAKLFDEDGDWIRSVSRNLGTFARGYGFRKGVRVPPGGTVPMSVRLSHYYSDPAESLRFEVELQYHHTISCLGFFNDLHWGTDFGWIFWTSDRVRVSLTR